VLQLGEPVEPRSIVLREDALRSALVVVGPFATRDEAETAGRSLGRPFFIVERDLPAPTRP
jgi:hypothetical protein